MHKIRFIAAVIAVALIFPAGAYFSQGLKNAGAAEEPQKSRPISAVVLTGGHGYNEKEFAKLFQGHDGMKFDFVRLKKGAEVFDDVDGWDYDVIVLYNMTQKITPAQRKNFLTLLEGGVGLVVMHHAIAAWQQWDEYEKIIGAKYYLKKTDSHRASGWKHDDIEIRIKPDHPITKKLKGFTIHDEVYNHCSYAKDNHVLLTTDCKHSDGPLAWTRTYKKANVFYILPGHGTRIFSHDTYRTIFARAVKWAASDN